MNTLRTVYLTPPEFNEDQIKEKIICIRAHRERLFNVSVQWHNGTLMCHNYGQGGAGWTFLFGCVQESIRLFEEQIAAHPEIATQPLCVVGAGCYGLLTAILLRRKGYVVKIIAKDTQNSASHKAAGFFFPRPRKSSTPEECAIFHARGMASYRTYQQIARGEHPFLKRGARLLPAYFSVGNDPGFDPYLQEGLIAAPEKVMINFGNGKQYTVLEYNMLFIDVRALMHELQQEVDRLKIPMVCTEIAAWDELPESIIFNCAGLGAKLLTGDVRLIPVQGHLITLQQQPDASKLQYMINVKVVMTDASGNKRDELIYYAPKDEGIVGITFKRGTDSLTSNHHEFDRLITRCRDFFGN